MSASTTVTVYTRPSCIQCLMTRRRLEAQGIEYVELPLDDEVVSLVSEAGYTSAPGVVVRTGMGLVIDVWGGFNPARIDKWAHAIHQEQAIAYLAEDGGEPA